MKSSNKFAVLSVFFVVTLVCSAASYAYAGCCPMHGDAATDSGSEAKSQESSDTAQPDATAADNAGASSETKDKTAAPTSF